MTNSTISGNSAADVGGGVFNSGTATITNSTISGNSAIEGAGVWNTQHGTVVHGSRAASIGGGVFNSYRAGLTFTDSTVSGNAVRSSGDVSTYGRGSISLVNSTLHDNTASNVGGGIVNDRQGSVELIHSLISGNSAASGAEVYNNPDSHGITPGRFNLFGHRGLTNAQAFENFTPGMTDTVATADDCGGEPPWYCANTPLRGILVTSLADNGGPTRTHALPSSSPAVDAITDGTCPPPNTDQRGIARPQDGDGDGGAACDIGSYERR
jgi:hypothetical protein